MAIKILSKRKLRKLPAGESAVRKEVEVLSKLRHVNIVEHIDYFSIDEKQKMYPYSHHFTKVNYSIHRIEVVN